MKVGKQSSYFSYFLTCQEWQDFHVSSTIQKCVEITINKTCHLTCNIFLREGGGEGSLMRLLPHGYENQGSHRDWKTYKINMVMEHEKIAKSH